MTKKASSTKRKKVAFTVDYFIKKFTATKPSEWLRGNFVDEMGRKCALGHCGARWGKDHPSYRHTTESRVLDEILGGEVEQINDGNGTGSPRTRILNALKAVKRAQEKSARK